MKIYDGIRYLVLFCSGLYGEIYHRIRYLISKKVVLLIVLIIISQESEWIHIILFHNVTILINSIVNKNEINYYYNIFLEKGLYENKSNTQLIN